MEFPRGEKLSQIVVGSVMGTGLLFFIWHAIPDPRIRWGLVFLALYEAYTILNKYAADTITEATQALSRRPVVPFLFGLTFGIGLGVGYIIDPYVIAGTFFVLGHLFFPVEGWKVNSADSN